MSVQNWILYSLILLFNPVVCFCFFFGPLASSVLHEPTVPIRTAVVALRSALSLDSLWTFTAFVSLPSLKPNLVKQNVLSGREKECLQWDVHHQCLTTECQHVSGYGAGRFEQEYRPVLLGGLIIERRQVSQRPRQMDSKTVAFCTNRSHRELYTEGDWLVQWGHHLIQMIWRVLNTLYDCILIDSFN